MLSIISLKSTVSKKYNLNSIEKMFQCLSQFKKNRMIKKNIQKKMNKINNTLITHNDYDKNRYKNINSDYCACICEIFSEFVNCK